MADLLDLPEKVLKNSILPFLQWNDLLRCRRVCKAIKSVTDDYIRLNPEKAQAPEIEVTEQPGKDLKALLALKFPISKLFLNNPTGHQFYDNLSTATLTNFTTTYGSMITSLRVVQLSVHPCFKEWTFLEALVNLKTFEAGGYGLGVAPSVGQRTMMERKHLMRARTDPRVPKLEPFTYPPNFKNLEVLKIGHNEQYCISDTSNRLAIFLKNLLKLEHISFPIGSDTEGNDGRAGQWSVHPFSRNLHKIYAHIMQQGQKLKYVDFINYHKEREMKVETVSEMYLKQCSHIMTLIANCSYRDVKFLNVNPAWFQKLKTGCDFMDPFDFKRFGLPVVSLVNLHSCVFLFNMPNLERINICQTSRSNVGNVRPYWPALKTLEINVNSKTAEETNTPTQDTALLFKFLWKDIVREKLTELSLRFQDEKVNGELAIPKTEDIVSACPNLKKLRIENWPGISKQLTKLWNGLPRLEELALEYCKDLENADFVGNDFENPVFLQLISLKKLTLRGLDQMPKITDTMFFLVLAKMNLTHLIIASDKPLENITKIGIMALLEGKFGETIEKFPFHGWSLASMSAEDFETISKQFRSYNML